MEFKGIYMSVSQKQILQASQFRSASAGGRGGSAKSGDSGTAVQLVVFSTSHGTMHGGGAVTEVFGGRVTNVELKATQLRW